MPYGRLDVYWPDGRLETYMLDDDTVSVGRAEGNTIALDTEAISRYHFSIVKDEETIRITDLDSANGTYVDGRLLPTNDPYALGDVEEIQAGSLRIIFRKMDDSPTVAMRPYEVDTEPLEKEATRIRLNMDTQYLDVWPASSSSTELAITHLGAETRRFAVRVSGMPGEWLRVTRPELELEPDETGYVLINVKPPRRPTTKPDRYMLTIAVAPIDEPDDGVHATLDVQVHAYRGFGMALAPQVDADDPVSVFLHNQGSAPLTLTLSAEDAQQALDATLPPMPLTLQPGQHLRVEMHVRSNQAPLIGRPREYPFILKAKSHDPAAFLAVTEGKAKVPARVPTWMALSAGGILVSIVMIGLLALLGVLSPPPEPRIESLRVSENPIAQGETLTLIIASENAQRLDILVDGRVVQADVPGDRQSIDIETEALSGTVEITVLAYNGRQSAEASVNGYVYIPARIDSFTVQPDTLVRYTVETLTISWNAPGAVAVRIRGLEEFTNQLFQASTEYSAQHTLEGVGGIASEALELTLLAEDEQGNITEELLSIPVIDPTCTAQRDLTLRQGPDERYAAVGSVAAESSIIVNAQDTEAAWLRVQRPGDVQGWAPLEGLQCAATFAVSDLRTVSDYPPLPTETPSVEATPEATQVP